MLPFYKYLYYGLLYHQNRPNQLKILVQSLLQEGPLPELHSVTSSNGFSYLVSSGFTNFFLFDSTMHPTPFLFNSKVRHTRKT